MRHLAPERRLGALATAGVAALSIATGIGAKASPPDAPAQNGLSGSSAIEALGSQTAAVAAQHGWSVAQLRQELRTDPALRFDGTDGLFYEEPAISNTDAASAAWSYSSATTFDPAQTFTLHSNPGASKILLLDFDGHITTGTPWNSSYGASITSGPYDIDNVPGAYSEQELTNIWHIWARVADDFSPLDVDVTTQDPGVDGLLRSGSGDQTYGTRVVISPTNWYSSSAGGVAYIGSFNWSTDTPAFVFTLGLGNGAEKYTAEAASHEAGHTLGLAHDASASTGYYTGHGDWAPIMGVGYYEAVSQWSRGEYAGANNTQDDLTVMTGYGPVTRADDVGDTPATSSALGVSGTTASGAGRIERSSDRDVFRFTTAGGSVSLSVAPTAPHEPNLDLQARLLDAAGDVLATSDPPLVAAATLSVAVPAGTFYVEVDGVGYLDPASTGYSDYASLGTYRITGTVPPADGQPPVAVAGSNTASGTAPLTVTFSSAGSTDPDGGALSYSWSFGDGSAPSSEANPTHTYTSAGTYTAVLTVTDPTGATGAAPISVSVTAPPTASRVVTVGQVALAKGTRTVTATIVVTDTATGAPIAGATVNGSWSGAVNGGVTALTDANGRVTVSKQWKKKSTITFTVTSVAPVAPDTWDGERRSASV
jgi:PKD repeat protein